MIIVTGGMGLIGSNITKALNERNITETIVVDDLTDGSKATNLADCQVEDYLDIDEFRRAITNGTLPSTPAVIFHQGDCFSTTEQNGKDIMDANFTFSKEIFHYCRGVRASLIYASSAAVYGKMTALDEEDGSFDNNPMGFPASMPLNVYGYSQLLFDQYVRAYGNDQYVQIVGLRYFNVYGPREQYKGLMASAVYQMHQQLARGQPVKLFGEHDGYAAGTQSRDFIHVSDVVSVNLWFLDHKSVSGIFDVGTDCSATFREVARAVSTAHGSSRSVEFVRFPEHLKGRYQSYTRANIRKLRLAGFQGEFKTVDLGVQEYVADLIAHNGRDVDHGIGVLSTNRKTRELFQKLFVVMIILSYVLVKYILM